jgi:hypothetical protein
MGETADQIIIIYAQRIAVLDCTVYSTIDKLGMRSAFSNLYIVEIGSSKINLFH